MPKLEPESMMIKISLSQIIDSGNIRDLKKYGPDKEGKYPEDIRELAESIKTVGQLQPVNVKLAGEVDGIKQYELIAGFRRRAAFQYLCSCGDDFNQINATIATGEKLIIQLVENIQREDLTAPEREAAIFKLATEIRLKQKEIASQLSKTAAYVSINMSAWKMRQRAQNAGIDLSGIETSTLSELLSVPDAELLKVLWNLVRLGGTRAAAASLAAPYKKGKTAAPEPPPMPEPGNTEPGADIDPLIDVTTGPEPAPPAEPPPAAPQPKKPEPKPGKPAAPPEPPIEAEHRQIDLNIILTVIYDYIKGIEKEPLNVMEEGKIEAAKDILALIHKKVDDA